jgi:hypothetical protein
MKIRINFVNGAMLGLVGGLAGGGVWVVQHGRFPAPFVEHPILAVSVHVLIALFFGAILRFIPTGRFNEIKITSFNTISWYKTVGWNEVASVKIVDLLVIKYLLLYTDDSRWAVWVPLNITQKAQLFKCMSDSGNEVLKSAAKA